MDPIEDNYDVIIRVDPTSDERLVGRRILEDECLLIAPPGVPVALRTERDDIIEALPAVGHTATPPDIVWRIETDNAVRVIKPDFRLRFSSFLMIREAVLAGGGVALMPKLLVGDDIAAGRLVSWGAEHGRRVEIWALQNSRRLSSPKIRAFLQALTSITR